jgi:hypothetical protein
LNLVRTFGYGVPDLDRALYSQESALTYIAQETIQPFNFKIKEGKKIVTLKPTKFTFSIYRGQVIYCCNWAKYP